MQGEARPGEFQRRSRLLCFLVFDDYRVQIRHLEQLVLLQPAQPRVGRLLLSLSALNRIRLAYAHDLIQVLQSPHRQHRVRRMRIFPGAILNDSQLFHFFSFVRLTAESCHSCFGSSDSESVGSASEPVRPSRKSEKGIPSSFWKIR